jgi:hypothetical protein
LQRYPAKILRSNSRNEGGTAELVTDSRGEWGGAPFTNLQLTPLYHFGNRDFLSASER